MIVERCEFGEKREKAGEVLCPPKGPAAYMLVITENDARNAN
jgi:hypothetical protein